MSARSLALACLLSGCGEHPTIATLPPNPCLALGPEAIVGTESGPVQGQPAGASCAFNGIAYAAPPIGPQRFRPPIAPAAWGLERSAREFGPACLQIDLGGNVSGSEDCLYLNVWVPDHEPSEALPVALFLHGGGNVSGSSAHPSYDGRELAARGRLVVVSANYRLGALGYLAHPALSAETEPPSSGNYGLLDQIAVLDWIQNNIVAFAGDPRRVMVFGQSAGARNLCALLVAPLASRLFQSAVLQSGACELEPLATQEEFGVETARAAGCPDGEASAACLRTLSGADLSAARPSLPNPLTASAYNPNVDGVLIPAAPLALLPARTAQTPILVMSNADEAGHVVTEIASASAYERWLATLYGADLGAQILSIYPASAYASPRAALLAVVNDGRYVCPARRSARAASAGGPAYRALFARGLDHGERSAYGAYHGLELLFVFRSFAAEAHTPSAAELAVSDAIIDAYARFATTGSPAGGALQFEHYDLAREPYTRIDSISTLDHGLSSPECDFWDSLGP